MASLAPDDGNGAGGASLITAGENKPGDQGGETKPPPADDAVAKAAAEKAAGEKLAADVAKLELKLPEGFDAKDATLADFKKLAAQAGLDVGKAQGFFDFHHKNLRSTVESASKALEQKFVDDLGAARKGWVDSIKADKEYGGDKLPETLKAAQSVFTRYETPELKQMLEDTGWGDHPEMVKLFARIGKDLGEDTVAKKTGGGGGAERAKGALGTDWKTLYPNSPELHG